MHHASCMCVLLSEHTVSLVRHEKCLKSTNVCTYAPIRQSVGKRLYRQSDVFLVVVAVVVLPCSHLFEVGFFLYQSMKRIAWILWPRNRILPITFQPCRRNHLKFTHFFWRKMCTKFQKLGKDIQRNFPPRNSIFSLEQAAFDNFVAGEKRKKCVLLLLLLCLVSSLARYSFALNNEYTHTHKPLYYFCICLHRARRVCMEPNKQSEP